MEGLAEDIRASFSRSGLGAPWLSRVVSYDDYAQL
ncbi:hypothetical protein FRAHR75_70116 [Frankia sp. Hr75.2]|nr:hypothetical protein FRAHR75_70116 [Frankia sp. Hr75.2]